MKLESSTQRCPTQTLMATTACSCSHDGTPIPLSAETRPKRYVVYRHAHVGFDAELGADSMLSIEFTRHIQVWPCRDPHCRHTTPECGASWEDIDPTDVRVGDYDDPQIRMWRLSQLPATLRRTAEYVLHRHLATVTPEEDGINPPADPWIDD